MEKLNKKLEDEEAISKRKKVYFEYSKEQYDIEISAYKKWDEKDIKEMPEIQKNVLLVDDNY